jgi:phosphotransferase system HPr (HPr) family protein
MNECSPAVSDEEMKCLSVVVPWREGLHLRHAVKLVKLARFFRSTISLRRGSKVADLRSLISIISLCATMGTTIDLEITGDDEQEAARAMERIFITQTLAPPASDAGAGHDANAPRRI